MATKKYKRKPYVPPKKAAPKPMSQKTKKMLAIATGAVILALALFFIFYQDGSLPLTTMNINKEDGLTHAIQMIQIPENEHWLTYNKGSKAKPKYFKAGALTFPEGWSFDESYTIDTDANIKEYCFRPDDQNSPFNFVYIRALNKEAGEVCKDAQQKTAQYYKESIVGDAKETTLNGLNCHYFFSKTKSQMEGQPLEMSQTFSLYLPANGKSSILINLSQKIDSMESGLSEEELLKAASDFISCLILDK